MVFNCNCRLPQSKLQLFPQLIITLVLRDNSNFNLHAILNKNSLLQEIIGYILYQIYSKFLYTIISLQQHSHVYFASDQNGPSSTIALILTVYTFTVILLRVHF
jgi:hypothetical protein